MLKLEPGMLIWTWVTFLFLLLVLRKLAWKPLLGAVEERERTIAESLKRANEAREEAERLLEEQQKKFARTQEEIQAMLKENKELAQKMRDEIIAQARADASKLIERAKQDIEKERQMAMQALKEEVANMVVYATARLIQSQLDEKKHREIIDQYIEAFGNQSEKN
ncbi:MAG: F0F1 ATP synthase subunit B [Calditrichaeota bacterium]|nr:F0F1 ATP synthase subunit B [Calditrichota bacterium]